MKRDFLKPYVYKVDGAVRSALYDIFHGAFYQLSPEDTDIQTLRKSLLEANLIFEPTGFVPAKMKVDIGDSVKKLHLRQFQVRINGFPEDNCRLRNPVSTLFSSMSPAVLSAVIEKSSLIPIRKLRIEAQDPDISKMALILERTTAEEACIYLKNLPDANGVHILSQIASRRNIHFTIQKSEPEGVEDLNVGLYEFFYSQQYNSCWGHQVAVDIAGEIKPCLWSPHVVGGIVDDELRKLIISGAFQPYWSINKDQVEVCKECELRYACKDCRTSAGPLKEHLNLKPSFCQYDPYGV